MKILLILISLTFCTNIFAEKKEFLSIEVMRSNILQLEESIKKTKKSIKTVKDAKFLPDLYFALAEFLVEKAKYMYTLKIEENKNTPIDEIDFTGEKRPKYEAIGVYESIYERFPSLKDRDKALFLKAHEQRELGLIEEMILTYKKLVLEFPKSQFWPESQLIIGNYLFEQKKEIDLALEVFQTIVKKPINAFTSIAWYKIGWCYINQSNFEKALLAFENTLDFHKKIDLVELPELYKKTDLRQDTLIAMVWPYSEIPRLRLKRMGDDRYLPVTYFKKMSFDKVSYEKVLFKLAKRLGVKKRLEEATSVYYELLTHTADVKERVDFIERLYVSAKNTLKRWPVIGFVQEVVKTMPLIQVSKDFKKNEKKKFKFDFEIYARDMATRLHERAKKTNKITDWQESSLAYKSYLSEFKKKKYYIQMRENLAESLYKSQLILDSAREYELLSNLVKDKSKKKDYLSSSLQAYLEVIKKGQDLLDKLEVVEVRSAIRQLGKKFEKAFPKSEIISDLHFITAQTYYDERNFDVAVKKFVRFVRMFKNSPKVKMAVDLILDSFNQREDYDGLIEMGKTLLDHKYLVNPRDKENVESIIEQAEMKLVQNKAKDFGSKKYSNSLLEMAEKYKGSSLGDKALYEAFMSLKSKQDLKAYQIAEELIVNHGSSKYAEDVALSITTMAITSADFDKAADYYELFHDKFPKSEKAKEFLKTAAMIRESMGDLKSARTDYLKLADRFKATKMLHDSQNWVLLKKESSQSSDLYSIYWTGLSYYRLKDFKQAEMTFTKLIDSNPMSDDEQDVKAHGLYLLAELQIRKYKQIKMKLGQEAQSVQEKNTSFALITQTLTKVAETSQKGRWALAGLYGLGILSKEFGNFIANAPLPKGLSAEEKKLYKKTLNDQASGYWQSSKTYFNQCISLGEKHLIMSYFYSGCKSNGQVKVDESKETIVITKSNKLNIPEANSIRKKLLKTPRDTNLLIQLSNLYSRKKSFAMSELILNRALEIKEGDEDLKSRLGVIKYNQNQMENAKFLFKEVNNTIALFGLKNLYKKFGYLNLEKIVSKKLSGKRLPASVYFSK